MNLHFHFTLLIVNLPEIMECLRGVLLIEKSAVVVEQKLKCKFCIKWQDVIQLLFT